MSTATDAAIIKEKNQSGKDFSSAFEQSEDGLLGRRREQSESMREYFEKLVTLKRRLAITGVRNAYVLNMNPYPLKVNSVLLADEIVPACPLGQPWIVHTLNKVLFQQKDEKDGSLSPVEFLPVMLIRDYEEPYFKQGGVVVFEATGNPNKPLTPEQEIANNPALEEKIAEARTRMLKFASEKYQEAETFMHSPGRVGFREINDLHRALTGLLFSERMIPEKPKWFEPTKLESDLADPCPRCKAEPKKGATMCPSCGFIINPAEAFRLGDLDVEVDADKRALMRLSREQLQELNISQHIDENLEERDVRLAKEAKRKPVPKENTETK